MNKAFKILTFVLAAIVVASATVCVSGAGKIFTTKLVQSEESDTPELYNFLQNGSFDKDLSNWDATGFEWEDGKARMNVGSSSSKLTQQGIFVIPGSTLTIRGHVSDPSATDEYTWIYCRIKAGTVSKDAFSIRYNSKKNEFGSAADANGYFEKTYEVPTYVSVISVSFECGTVGSSICFDDLFMTDGHTLVGQQITTTTTTRKPKTTGKTIPSETEPTTVSTVPSDVSEEETSSYLVGDANADEALDMKDVLMLRKYIAHLGDIENLSAADCNGDSLVDMKDVLLLRKYLAQMDVTLAEPTKGTTLSTTTGTESEVPKTTFPTNATGANMPEVFKYEYMATDQITLTFNDLEGLVYGSTWNTYIPNESATLQFVEGEFDDGPDFENANPTSIKAENSYDNTDQLEVNYDADSFVFQKGDAFEIVRYIHKVKFPKLGEGLKFGTTYSYRVGDPYTGMWSNIYKFTTREEKVSDYSFLWMSDTQFGSSDSYGGHKVMQLINQLDEKPSFLLHGGDFTDDGYEIHFYGNMLGQAADWFAQNLSFVCVGNHDASPDPIFNRFNYGESGKKGYFSYNYGNVHYIVLNTAYSSSLAEDGQLAWLENDLEENSKNPQTKWTIIGFHRPMFACTTPDSSHYVTYRKETLSLFDKYGVDLVMQAHTHVFSFSYPINADGTEGNYKFATDKSTIDESGRIVYNDPKGTIFVNIPCCGGVNRPLSHEYQQEFLQLKADGKKYSYAQVFVSDDELCVRASYRDDLYTTVGGYDEFTMNPSVHSFGELAIKK